MIAKLGKGAGFSGCAKYDLDQGHRNNKDARLLAAEGVPLKVKPDGSITINARDIGRAFRAQALALNPDIKQPVGRAMLAFNPKDTPRLTNDYMVKIAREYMEQMGIVNTQYTIVRHSEKAHQHVHIIYNRVDNDGKLINDSNNYYRSIDICKEITLREGLALGESKTLSRSIPNDPEERLRYEMARTVKKCVGSVNSLKGLQISTARHGITTTVKTNPNTGSPNGISFTAMDDNGTPHTFKGSSLDRSLSIGNIMKAIYGEDYAQTQTATRESQSQKETHGRGADVASSIAGMFGERSRRDEDEKIGQKKGRGMHM